MASTESALVVARWFLAKAAAADADLSNLKLQKLLYYAQGRYLARTGRALFPEPIEAWDHGPVVSTVYHACKGYGSGPVGLDVLSGWSQAAIDREAERILDAVWAEEGSLAAWKLRQMTHREAPWRDSFDGSRHKVIPVDAIREYFSSQHAARNLSIEAAFAEWADESLQLADEFLPVSSKVEW